MRIVIATTDGDRLGGVFARSYYDARGPAPSAIITLPDRADLRYPAWAQPIVALKLTGFRGSVRLQRASIGMSDSRDRRIGLDQPWPESLARFGTTFHALSDLRDESKDVLSSLRPDLLISIGVPRIIPRSILEVPRVGALNVHNGTLPEYRGHFATFWEIVSGAAEGGVSIHSMTATVDRGAVLAEARVAFAAHTSLLDVLIEKKRVGGALLADLLNTIAQTDCLPAGVSHPSTGSYFGWPKLSDIGNFSFKRIPRS